MNRIFLSLLLIPCLAIADSEKKNLSSGAFIDGYYGFDFNQPTTDRGFTTQALRHNEFAINLAFIEIKAEKPKTHGRLAFQTGTSVYNNYSSERNLSGPLGEIVQHLQEAYGGVKLFDDVWLDAGIFFSHIGAESFISRDNWNYTRSLGADFSPYYQTGVRLNAQVDSHWSFGLQVLNGWQNIIENNSDKALGMQIVYSPNETFSVTYNNFIGREANFRFFNNFILKAKVSDSWSVSLSSDIGFQRKSSGTDFSQWYAETLLTQYRLSDKFALGGRLEYFYDKDQIVAATDTPNGFRVGGASINLDCLPESDVLIRNEIRTLFSQDAIFPGRTVKGKADVALVTSLALTM